jgi:hypothetical protein
MESPNVPALIDQLDELGMDSAGITRVFRTFNSGSPAFATAGLDVSDRSDSK